MHIDKVVTVSDRRLLEVGVDHRAQNSHELIGKGLVERKVVANLLQQENVHVIAVHAGWRTASKKGFTKLFQRSAKETVAPRCYDALQLLYMSVHCCLSGKGLFLAMRSHFGNQRRNPELRRMEFENIDIVDSVAIVLRYEFAKLDVQLDFNIAGLRSSRRVGGRYGRIVRNPKHATVYIKVHGLRRVELLPRGDDFGLAAATNCGETSDLNIETPDSSERLSRNRGISVRKLCMETYTRLTRGSLVADSVSITNLGGRDGISCDTPHYLYVVFYPRDISLTVTPRARKSSSRTRFIKLHFWKHINNVVLWDNEI